MIRGLVLVFLARVVNVECMIASGALYDQAAVDHVLSVLNAMASGKFEKYRAFCMEEGAWISVLPPAVPHGTWLMAHVDWSLAIHAAKAHRGKVIGTRRRGLNFH